MGGTHCPHLPSKGTNPAWAAAGGCLELPGGGEVGAFLDASMAVADSKWLHPLPPSLRPPVTFSQPDTARLRQNRALALCPGWGFGLGGGRSWPCW